MITSYKIEDKTKEQVLEKIKNEFHLSEKDIYIVGEKTSCRLFKGDKIEIEFVKKEDILLYIKQYIDTFKEKMQLEIKAEVSEKDDYYSIRLTSDNNALLIGKNGKNINSLQHILQQSLKSKLNFPIKISIDAGDYKYKKEKQLELEVKKIAEEVLNTKVTVHLDPMNSYSRRIVHNVISQFENLKSKSIGEEPNRYIQICYVEK